MSSMSFCPTTLSSTTSTCLLRFTTVSSDPGEDGAFSDDRFDPDPLPDALTSPLVPWREVRGVVFFTRSVGKSSDGKSWVSECRTDAASHGLLSTCVAKRAGRVRVRVRSSGTPNGC
eukprot:8499117-Pyramimonas_sp.AAC.1